MNHKTLLTIAILTAACGSSPIEDAKTVATTQAEICAMAAQVTPETLALLDRTEPALAKQIARAKALCEGATEALETICGAVTP